MGKFGKLVTVQTNFVCHSSGKVNFGQKSEILCLLFSNSLKLPILSAILSDGLKNH